MTRATLCIDAGTTLVKAVVFDPEGNELVVTRRSSEVLSPQRGFAEQDMEQVWLAVADAAAEAIALSPLTVDRVAVTAQGDGAWLVDAEGVPVRPAILWNDGRSRDVLDRWRATDVLERAYRLNGSLSNLGLPNAILATLAVEEPESFARTSAVLTCGSWLFLRFSGILGLSNSDASAPWLDATSGRYSDELLEEYGMEGIRPLLPPLLASDQIVHPLLPAVASALGLEPGIPVVLAPYDVVATAAGGGSVEPGSAFCILGTTLCTGVVTETVDTSGTPGGLTLRVSESGPLVRAFPTLAGTGVLDWLAGILRLEDAAAVTELAAASTPGANGVTVWPYLSPAGERAPFLDPDARGVIGGLRFDHDSADLARAAVEGLAHVIRECLDAGGVLPTELALSGGGSMSSLWCQVLADVTGVPTTRSSDSQIGAKGAMVYAAVATGQFESVRSAASALVRSAARFEPDASVRALHDRRHEDFLRSRAVFAERWPVWAGES